jgi:hypothetical protein
VIVRDQDPYAVLRRVSGRAHKSTENSPWQRP